MNKKAYLKTLEAVIAVILLLIFIAEVLPHKTEETALTPNDIETTQQTILKSISSQEDLRAHALAGGEDDIAYLKDFIDSIIQPSLSYELTITPLGSSLQLPTLPTDKAVYSKTLVISATTETYAPKLIRLFIWRNFE